VRKKVIVKANEIKDKMYALGADLCGIASPDRFAEAPEGFHPLDVLPSCRSVIVFANAFLAGTVYCGTTVPYTIVRNILSDRMDKMAVQFCMDLEREGIVAVPCGTNGPTEFDVHTQRRRNIVSAKHCAQAAGMGVIGKNTLLITPEYGNMVWLSVVLTELELEADPLLEAGYCPPACHLCIDACPAGALGEPAMDQEACWAYAFGGENGGEFKIKCHRCRTVCPHHFGSRNKHMRRTVAPRE
jgi:epoxyqueuosine reductase